ncbi:MAG: hypothetical protein R2746_02220 [Acidimicrobiales bacterium]
MAAPDEPAPAATPARTGPSSARRSPPSCGPAHEQAGGLRRRRGVGRRPRQQAEADAASIRAQAAAGNEAVKAAAEQDRTEAAGKLAAAQAEALGLVADAQARVDHLIETSRQRALTRPPPPWPASPPRRPRSKARAPQDPARRAAHAPRQGAQHRRRLTAGRPHQPSPSSGPHRMDAWAPSVR